MFTRVGSFAVRRRRAVLIGSALVLLTAGVLGTGVFGRLSGGGFEDPTSDSARAKEVLERTFHTGSPNYLLLVDAPAGTSVDSPEVTSAAAEVTARLLDDPGVAEAVSYWSLGNVPPLRSADGDSALIVARLAGDEDAVQTTARRLTSSLTGSQGVAAVSAGGQAPVFQAVSTIIEEDLATAESMALPATLLLLVVVFGGLVAAGLPLLVGVASVLGTFLTLYLVTLFTDVSVYSINLVTALGLGLAIDYSLFIVSRYREELRAGRDVEAAVIRLVETAGRTVAVSALTVAVSLAALLVFPLYFLRSFAYAGVGVTLLAACVAVLTLPALLAVLGHRVDSLRLLPHREAKPVGEGFWHRVSTAVMKRPVVVSISVVTFLVLLGLPFLGVAFGAPDQRVLPPGTTSRVTTDRIIEEFASDEVEAFPVVVPSGGPTDAAIDAYAAQLSGLGGVSRVDATTGRYIAGRRVVPADAFLATYRSGDAVRLNVVPSVNPMSPEGEALVEQIRSLDPPFEQVLVGGQSARLVDSKAAIAARLPLAAGIIAGATFVLLFLMFGSVLVPIKAIVLNVLSLTATFGAMVWVFQDGHGAGVLGFTPTGLTDTTMPILMFCIAFGLSMDYEVFLLSRIKEEYDRTGDNTQAVAAGLERTGRIVTAAAALLAITFLAFATSGITFIKLFGLGLALAVVMDATLIRATLVPAFMKLAGDANWWAPRWMRSVHERFGFSEHEHGPEPVVVGPVAQEGVDVGAAPAPRPVLNGVAHGPRPAGSAYLSAEYDPDVQETDADRAGDLAGAHGPR